MSTPFEKVVRQACEITAELNRLQSKDNRLMSAGYIVQQCLSLADSNPERLNALKWMIFDSKRDSLQSCAAFIRGVARAFAEGRVNSSAPSSIARMNYPGRDAARAELAELGGGYSLYELWALGCQQAAIKYPEQFGSVTDSAAYQERIDELKAKRDALLERIPDAWGAEDVILGSLDREGRSRVTLRIAPSVTLGPLENLGSRLIDHLTSVEPPAVSSASQALKNGVAA